ncbi:ubiquinol-cytochrome c reductase iron-sulfur subunit [Marinomonas sp. 15G1-11]|uniref:Ubiquinol-cytochrome c reductase iron-sulfur subunit n=1 Tax=Marinomonas phaeophyticola TaxID=3004091 RepID=A0ABT4JXD6_9GAMM|nr:ubiquinol-cytochrome c reductase iron-sulfur subunit [Marinomonas sp. 15G1-11]MCZ2723054.1 ubiquinol-cytochrome c reductase iron-sulfur subunit [Marinomonas sp. 15G1-11]
MSQSGVNKGRRRFLIGATSAIGAVGAVGVATPFVASWNPSAKAKAAGAPVKVDISKLEVGQQMIVEWRGQPVWVVNRTPETLSNLEKISSKLSDPESIKEQQPSYAQNSYRSIKPEISILLGICTHLGCSPTYRPEIAPEDLGPEWVGGYFCPCHGSKFDLAGRVYNGVPAPINLSVPPHQYLTDTVIEIGVDGGNA